MGKKATAFLVISIIVVVGCIAIMSTSKAVQSEVLLKVDGDDFSSNETVNLKSLTYIFRVSYYFQYYEETTMDIVVYLTNTATSEVQTVSFSLTSISAYVETKYDYETFTIAEKGTYRITYSCSHVYFSASSSRFTLVKPSLFQDLSDPEQVVTYAEQGIDSLAYRIASLVLVFGVLGLICSTIFFVQDRKLEKVRKIQAENPAIASNITYQEPIYNNSQQWQQPQVTEQTLYQSTDQNPWMCSYCYKENNNTGRFCVNCGKERQN